MYIQYIVNEPKVNDHIRGQTADATEACAENKSECVSSFAVGAAALRVVSRLEETTDDRPQAPGVTMFDDDGWIYRFIGPIFAKRNCTKHYLSVFYA